MDELLLLDQTLSNLAATSGTNRLEFPLVAPDEVWVLRAITGYDDTSVASAIRVGYHNGARDVWFESSPNPAAKLAVSFRGRLTIRQGQRVVVQFEGATSGDDLYASINGYRLKLT